MQIKLTVLCENSVSRVSPGGLLGEYGFACLIETDRGNYLFDTGGGLTLFHNAALLNKDLSDIDGLILSHGHYDHVGGLQELLKVKSPLPIFTHPDLFNSRISHNGKVPRDIGTPWSQAELEAAGAEFHFAAGARKLSPELTLSGEIPRLCAEETGDPNLLTLTRDGKQIADPLSDDQSLFIASDKGLVLLLGCAHAGLVNIIDHALQISGQDKIYMIVGGTHLRFCSQTQLAVTMDKIESVGVDRIGASHCTGFEGAAALAERFGRKFFTATVGTEILL